MRKSVAKLFIVIVLFLLAVAAGLYVLLAAGGENEYYIEVRKEITVYAGQSARLSPVLYPAQKNQEPKFTLSSSDNPSVIIINEKTGEFKIGENAKRGSGTIHIEAVIGQEKKAEADVKVNIIDELTEIISINPLYSENVNYKESLSFEVKALPKYRSENTEACKTTLQEFMSANEKVKIDVKVVDNNNNLVEGIVDTENEVTVIDNIISVPTYGLGSGMIEIIVKNGEDDMCKGNTRFLDFALCVNNPVVNTGLLSSADIDANGLATADELSELTRLSLAPTEENVDLSDLNEFPAIKHVTLNGDKVFKVTGTANELIYYVDKRRLNDYINDSNWLGKSESLYPSAPLDDGNVWVVIHSEFFNKGREVEYRQVEKGTLPAGLENNEEYKYDFGGWVKSADKGQILSGITENSHIYPFWIAVDEHSLSLPWWFSYSEDGEFITGLTDNWVYYNGSIDKTRLRLPEEYILGIKIKGIAQEAFTGKEINSVFIPECVEKIGDGAFENCLSLSDVGGGVNVEQVGLNSFKNTVWYNTQNTDANNKFITLGKVIVRYLPDSVGNVTLDQFNAKHTVIAAGAFADYGADAIDGIEVSLPSSIKRVDRLAFENANISRLNAQSSVTVYDETAFSGCVNIAVAVIDTAIIPALPTVELKDLTVNGNGEITSSAFAYAENLEIVKIASSITAIASDAFNSTVSLSQITVVGDTSNTAYYSINNCLVERKKQGNSVQNVLVLGCKDSKIPLDESISAIGDYAFAGCTGLIEITIPNSVKEVASNAFDGCTAIEKVTLPSFAVASIPRKALREVVLTSGTEVLDNAFKGADLLEKIEICESIINIGEYAFADCKKLATVDGGVNVEVIGESAFRDTAWLNGVNNGGILCLGSVLVRYAPDGSGKFTAVLPEGVTTIGLHAFEETNSQQYRLKEIAIPEGVKRIEESAFGNCTEITTLLIPNTVTNIVSGAFIDCNAVVNATLPAYAVEFIYKQRLKTVSINGGQIIGSSAFTTSEQLETVVIGSTITTISDNAFSNCDKLSSLVIPSSVIRVSDNAFTGCDNISDLTTSTVAIGKISVNNLVSLKVDGGTTVPERAFENAAKLNTVEILQSVQNIGMGAFSGCSSLTGITLPFIGASIQTSEGSTALFGYIFGDTAFNGSTNTEQRFSDSGKTAYYIPDSLNKVTVLGGSLPYGAFSGCAGISEIVLPQEVNEIVDYAFYNCANLEDYDFDGVQTIGDYAFYGCSAFTELHLSDARTIGGYAFASCSGLTEIEIDGVKTIGGGVFGGCTSLESIKVPFVGESIHNSYSSASTLFGHIFGEIPCIGCTAVEQYYSSVGKAVYYIPENLQSVQILGGEIPYGAFYGMTNLISVTLPDNLQTIGAEAFKDCKALQDVVIPESVTSVGQSAFTPSNGSTLFAQTEALPEGWDNVWYVGSCSVVWNYGGEHGIQDGLLWAKLNNETIAIYGYSGDEIILEIPEVIENSDVTEISENAFNANQQLTEIKLCGNITSVGKGAFADMPELQFTEIDLSVIRMSENSFEGSAQCIIFAVAESQPSDWNKNWNPSDCLVIWNFANEYSIDGSVKWALLNDETVAIFGYNANEQSGWLDLTEADDYTVSKIMRGALENLNSVNIAVISEAVTYVGENAFKNCKGLTIYCMLDDKPSSWHENWNPDPCFVVWNYDGGYGTTEDGFSWVRLHNDKTAILQYVGTSSFVTVPEKIENCPVVTIFGNAFSGNTDVFSVTLPSELEQIDENAFKDCLRLTEVINYSGLIISKGDSKNGGVALRALDIHNGETSKLYTNKDGYVFLECDEGVFLVAYTGNQTTLILPEKYNEKSYEINDYAFYNCTNITSVSVPKTVTKIGYSVFFGCGALESLTLPFVGKSGEEVEASPRTLFGYIFGDKPFDGTSEVVQRYVDDVFISHYVPDSLRSVTILGGTIHYGAFYNCVKLENIILPEDIKEISERVFFECNNLSQILIPESVTQIDRYAFFGCKKLESIEIHSNIKNIGEMAFLGCLNLKRVDIDDLSAWMRISFQGIEANPLYFAGELYVNDNALTELTVPDEILSIPDYCFYHLTCLEKVNIRSGIEIGSLAFTRCVNLKHLNIDAGAIINGDNLFSGCRAIEYADVPVNFLTFIHNDSLKILIINSGEKIEKNALKDSVKLRSVQLADSVTEIGEGAFSGCTALTQITGGNNVNKAEKQAFADTPWSKSVENGGLLTIGKVIVRYVTNNQFNLCTTKDNPLNGNIVWVYDYAFAGASIGEVNINNLSNVMLGYGAFKGATIDILMLGSFSGTQNNKLDELFDGNGTVNKITLADGVTETTMNMNGNGITVNTIEASGKGYTSATITGFKSIVILNLSNNKLTSLDLTSICAKKIEINLNSVTELSCTEPNTFIERIYMPADNSNNALTNLAFTKNLPNLVSLDVANNKINNLEGLETLENLTELYLGGNPVLKIEAQMNKLKAAPFLNKLVRLNLGDCSKETKAIVLDIVERSTSLVWLQIYNIGASSADLTSHIKKDTHKNLKYIKISHNGIANVPDELKFIQDAGGVVVIDYSDSRQDV